MSSIRTPIGVLCGIPLGMPPHPLPDAVPPTGGTILGQPAPKAAGHSSKSANALGRQTPMPAHPPGSLETNSSPVFYLMAPDPPERSAQRRQSAPPAPGWQNWKCNGLKDRRVGRPSEVRIPHPAHAIQPYKHWTGLPPRIQSPVSQAGSLLANPGGRCRRTPGGESAAARRPPREGQGRSALPQPSGDRRAAWKDALASLAPRRTVPPGTVPPIGGTTSRRHHSGGAPPPPF